jgi:hypothetical protein
VRNGAYLQAITGNSRITWYLGVTALSDTTKQIIPPQDGLYMVVSDSNGCIATSNRYLVTFTGVANALEQNQVRVYPNPFSDVLRIESTLKGHYVITEITGRICKAGEIREGLNTITTAEFKAGVYILHIDKTYIRIVKQ